MDLAQQDSDVIQKEMDEIPTIIESEELEVIEVIEYYATDPEDPDNENSLESTEKKSEESIETQKNTIQNICTENLENKNENVPVITYKNRSPVTYRKRCRVPHCPKKCYLQISKEKQKLIFKSYWSDESNTGRKRFLNQMISMKPGPNFFGKFPRTSKYDITFYLDADNGRTEFCRSCFTNILNERDSVVTLILEDKFRELFKWKEQRYHLLNKNKNATIKNALSSENAETFSPRAIGLTIFGNLKPPSFKPYKSHCGLRLTVDDQYRIFKSYWKNSTFESRFTFINEAAVFTKMPPAKQYSSKFFLNTEKGYQKVCTTCFRFILGESWIAIKIILDDKWREASKFDEPVEDRTEEWIAFVNREGKRQKIIKSLQLQGKLVETVKPKISNESERTCVVKEEIDLGYSDSESQLVKIEKKSEAGLQKIVEKQTKRRQPLRNAMSMSLGEKEFTNEDCDTEKISEIGLSKIVVPSQKQDKKNPVLYQKIVVPSQKQDEKKTPVSDEILQNVTRMREYTKEYCKTGSTQETLPEFSNYNHLLLQDAMEDITANKLKKGWTRLPLCKNKCANHVTEQDQARIFETYRTNATTFSRYKYINDLVDIIPFNRMQNTTKHFRPRTFLSYYYLDTEKGRHKVCISCFCTAIDEQRAFVTIALREKKRSALKEYKQSKYEQLAIMKKESNSTDEFANILDINYDSSSTIAEEKLEDETRDQMSVKDLIKHMIETDALQKSRLLTYMNIERFVTKEHLEEVEKHINKFPCCESHNFNDQHSGTCLPMGLTMEIAYDLYISEVPYPVDFDTYEEILKQRDIKFKPELLGKCEICHYTAKYAKNHPTERNIITSLRMSHLDEFKEAEKSKFQDLNIKARPYLVCTFGFQQSLPTPFLSIPKAFYKQPLWTYNFVVQQLVKNKGSLKDSNFYMWHEAVGKKTANEMASCLFKYLEDLPCHIKTVVFYSSSNKGKSRSKALAMMFINLIHNHKTLECIDHKFLVDGHPVVEENAETCWTSKIVQRNLGKVQQPKDWYNAFTEPVSSNIHPKVVTMTPEMFYEFEGMGNNIFKSCINDKIKWLRFTRNGIFYKTTLSRTKTFRVMNLKCYSPLNEGIWNSCKKDLCQVGITPITRKRKNDLLDLVNLMSPVLPGVKKFYASLLTREEIDERLPTKRKLQKIDQKKNESLLRGTCIVKEEEIDFENGDLQSRIEEEEPPKKMLKEVNDIDSINFEHIEIKEEYY
ncbi:uncharacterized protein LOC117179798 isoform X2 [Belonocnema kinseyi]|uniref:uncharacterized protein LOC117179798 isoform X2 n=1 Tax=Belonocnema kinseyi TaxID=2817044 RepID=UPI00143DFF55|nr:uncharacterized protein LOC117179798 isoform X2 [Belonocnema kinseyi]